MNGRIKTIVVLVVVGIICLLSLFLRTVSVSPVRAVTIGSEVVSVEFALTPNAQRQGLSDRVALPQGRAMVFPFYRIGDHAMWMRRMLFPIDIVWIRNGEIIDIAPNVPVPSLDTAENNLPIYHARLPSDTVLELPAHDAERLQLHIGTVIPGLRFSAI